MRTLLLGTMTFGWSKSSRVVDGETAARFIQAFGKTGNKEIDTALIYMDSPGVAERMLGEIVKPEDGFILHSKAHPTLGVGGRLDGGGGGLNAANLRAQVMDSIRNLRISSLPLLYLHQPDPQTNLRETLKACNDLHSEGLIAALGMSNYSAKEVREATDICREESWLRPTVYQGNYNPLNRDVEAELLPTLAELNIRFLAYNPLAAGLLSGKYASRESLPDSGRFGGNKTYQDRYWKDNNFEAMLKIKSAAEGEGISLIQATFSWLKIHSALKDATNDGVLLGASSLEQLEENIACWQIARPLSPAALTAFEEAWQLCKHDAFSYFRGYSGAGGNAFLGISR